MAHAKATARGKEMESATVIKDMQERIAKHATKVSMNPSGTKANFFAHIAMSLARAAVRDPARRTATSAGAAGS